MEYQSFEEGLRVLASHQTGDEVFFGPLLVGLKTQGGERRPYLTLANHTLRLSDAEAANTSHIIIDTEKFFSGATKHNMRIEFMKQNGDWKIMQSELIKTSGLQEPSYTQMTELRSEPSSSTGHGGDVSFSLGNWRIGRLEVAKDNDSIGTVLERERAYCGSAGIQKNLAFLHQSAARR